MKFKNRENELINKDNIGNRSFFHSRSIALLCVIICRVDNKHYVLLEKRGSNLDEPNKWCVPCGYLDWDETCGEAVIREVYEESGLNLNDFKDKIVGGSLNAPYYFNDDPGANRQNVTFRYGIIIEVDKLPELKTDFCDEILDLRWVNISYLDMEEGFAFNHDNIIKDYFYYDYFY